MTNEEAIEVVKHNCICLDKRVGEALEVAIKAVSEVNPNIYNEVMIAKNKIL